MTVIEAPPRLTQTIGRLIRFRRGLDARSMPPVKFRIPDLMATASRVMELANSHERDAVFANVEYGYDASDAILLERKRDMRRRGLASPDDGDALALTFACPVERRSSQEESRIQQKLAVLKRRII